MILNDVIAEVRDHTGHNTNTQRYSDAMLLKFATKYKKDSYI